MENKTTRYSEAFKVEAIKKIADKNGNLSTTARQPGVSMQTLSNCQKKDNVGKLKGAEQYDPHLMSIIEENKRLKRELKIVQEERDILKKVTAYFANEER